MINTLVTKYKRNINFFNTVLYLTIILQTFTFSFHLFLPLSFESSNLSLFQYSLTLFLLLIVLLFVIAKILDFTNSNTKYIFRLMAFGGITHQFILGYDTLWTISLYTIFLLIEETIISQITLINRTQKLIIKDKLTNNTLSSVSNANNFLDHQINWQLRITSFMMVAIFITSIFFRTIEYLSNLSEIILSIIQLLGSFSLFLILIIIFYKGILRAN